MLPLATVVAYPVTFHAALLHQAVRQRIADCTFEQLTVPSGSYFYSSSDLLSVTELAYFAS